MLLCFLLLCEKNAITIIKTFIKLEKCYNKLKFMLNVMLVMLHHKHHIHLSTLHQHRKIITDYKITLISKELDFVPKYHILEPWIVK
jgi:hypothetical protein